MGLTVGDLDSFEINRYLVGESPQKWRSGVNHDASGVMEFTRTARGLENGFGETVDLESDYLYPLLKGSDVGSGKAWRGKYTLVTQRRVGEPTNPIREVAPKTWAYLENHAVQLDGTVAPSMLRTLVFPSLGLAITHFDRGESPFVDSTSTCGFGLSVP